MFEADKGETLSCELLEALALCASERRDGVLTFNDGGVYRIDLDEILMLITKTVHAKGEAQ